MTDSELAALASAFKSIIAEQAMAHRVQLEALRADLDAERVKSAEHRLFETESRKRMLATIADAVGDAVAPRFQELQRRTVELEHRSMGTAPEVAQ